MSSNSVFIVYLEDEYRNKDPLAQYFKGCMLGQGTFKHLKLWYANDSGPRSCQQAFVAALSCESTQIDSLNKRNRRTRSEGAPAETDEEYKIRIDRICGSPDFCGVVLLVSRELRKDVTKDESTNDIFQEWRWDEGKTQIYLEKGIDESLWKEHEKTVKSLARSPSVPQPERSLNTSSQSTEATAQKSEESKQPAYNPGGGFNPSSAFKKNDASKPLNVRPPPGVPLKQVPSAEPPSPQPPATPTQQLTPQTSGLPARSVTPVSTPGLQTPPVAGSQASPNFMPPTQQPPAQPPTQHPPTQLPPTQSPLTQTFRPQPLPPQSFTPQSPLTQPPSTQLPPTQLLPPQPPTQLPPTQLPPTQLPPTQLLPPQPPTQLPPTQLPPTQPPLAQPPTQPLPPQSFTPQPPLTQPLPTQPQHSLTPVPKFGLSGPAKPSLNPAPNGSASPFAVLFKPGSTGQKPPAQVQPAVSVFPQQTPPFPSQQPGLPTQPSPPFSKPSSTPGSLNERTDSTQQPHFRPPFPATLPVTSIWTTSVYPRPPVEEEKQMASSADLSTPRSRYIQEATRSLTERIEKVFADSEPISFQAVQEELQRFQAQYVDRINRLYAEVRDLVDSVSGIAGSVEAVKAQQQSVLVAMDEVAALVGRKQVNDDVTLTRQLLKQLNERYETLYQGLPPQKVKREAVIPVNVYRHRDCTDVMLENRKLYEISNLRIDIESSGYAPVLFSVPVLPPGQTPFRINSPLLGPGYIRLSQGEKKLYEGYISFDAQGCAALGQGPQLAADEQEVQRRINEKANRVWNLLNGQTTSETEARLIEMMKEPSFDVRSDEEIVDRLRRRS